jgi:threonine/homoserine/homoserine lactone efflux protein
VVGWSQLGLFAAAAIALLVVPGPAVLYVVAQSVSHGRAAGVTSALGVGCGALVHVVASAVGLSSLLASSAEAFAVVKYAGAAYLVWLGARRLLGRDRDALAGDAPPAPRARILRQGFVVEALNPKTALFFLAFLPQFVDRDAGAVALQIGLLGLLFVALGIVSDSLWALAAGTASRRLRRSPRVVRGERLVSGSLLVGLGVATAVTGSRKA